MSLKMFILFFSFMPSGAWRGKFTSLVECHSIPSKPSSCHYITVNMHLELSF